MTNQSYHNTNNLASTELVEANKKAKTQEQIVLAIFKEKNERLTPSMVWQIYCRNNAKNTPITSIRRAITNLTYSEHGGKLIKTKIVKEGVYGSPEHYYRINDGQVDLEDLI